MNLRKRAVTIDLTKKPEVKRKKKPVRRSERNKPSNKDQSENLKVCNDTAKEGPRPRSRRRRLGWSRKKKPCTVEEYPSALLFPPVIETGFNDLLEELEHASPEDQLLAREADVLYECRACHGFFRDFAIYLKHKQIYCTTLAHKGKKCRDDWNSLLNKLGFDFGSDESDSEEHDDKSNIEHEASDSEIEYSDADFAEVVMIEKGKKNVSIISEIPGLPETSMKTIIDEPQTLEHNKLLREHHCSEKQPRMIKIEPTSPEQVERNIFELESFYSDASRIKTEPITSDEPTSFSDVCYPNALIKTENQVPAVSNVKKLSRNVAKPVINKRKSLVIAEEENVCQFCSASFDKASDFRYHKRSEHYSQVLTYQCSICDARLLSIPKWERHVSKTHNVELFGMEIKTEVLNVNDPRLN